MTDFTYMDFRIELKTCHALKFGQSSIGGADVELGQITFMWENKSSFGFFLLRTQWMSLVTEDRRYCDQNKEDGNLNKVKSNTFNHPV